MFWFTGSHLWAMVRSPIDDLWWSVERAAAEGLQKLVLMVEVGQPEVSNLWKQRWKCQQTKKKKKGENAPISNHFFCPTNSPKPKCTNRNDKEKQINILLEKWLKRLMDYQTSCRLIFFWSTNWLIDDLVQLCINQKHHLNSGFIDLQHKSRGKTYLNITVFIQ